MSMTMKELGEALLREAEAYGDDTQVLISIGNERFDLKEAFLTNADATHPTPDGLAFVLEVDR